MVEDRVTDGKRIGQLLASELTGLTSGPMQRYGVTDADPEAEPSPDGTFAYAIVRDGERVGEVFLHDRGVRVDVSADASSVAGASDEDGLSVMPSADGSARVRVEYGAAVKRAVDALAAALDDDSSSTV